MLPLSGPEHVRTLPGSSRQEEQAHLPRAFVVDQTWPIPSTPLVDAVAEVQQDVAVPELEIPDESCRVPVPRRKDGHLEDLAGLHGGLVDSLPGQRLYGGSGQNPVRHLAILVRD